jgi:hypothetical protein
LYNKNTRKFCSSEMQGYRPFRPGAAMNEITDNRSTRYRIGAVARLMGITPDTL